MYCPEILDISAYTSSNTQIRFIGSGSTSAYFYADNVQIEYELNLPPVISLPGGAVNYTENDPAMVIDATATASDPNLGNFDTGTLTVDFTANGAANDRLAIRDQGAGVGNISLSGGNVRYDFGSGAVVIGTFSGGTSGS